MRIVALDFETYYDDEYTLDKMTTEAYVRDARFEAHGASVKWGPNMPARWYATRELRYILAQEDWSDIAVIIHHAHFDGLILTHHFGIKPKLWLDTLSMARMLIGNHLSKSLESLAKHFKLPPKTVPYNLFKNKHWLELSDQTRELVADGCNHDTELAWDCFSRLARDFPSEEYALVDMTVRMFTEPVLIGDQDILGKVWTDENVRRKALIAGLNIDPKVLSSNQQFAALLESHGVEVEYKKGKNEPIPAVAKNDDFMQRLLDDDDDYVAALAEARVNAKSTALQTRAETLGWMASRGTLCVYLHYCGAHTTRWSGGDGTNFQNFKRGHVLRQSLMAPDGWLLAVPDASQIECRLLNYLAGQDDMVEKFRNGIDPYAGLASEFYGRPITKADEAERGTGKQGELSCGYGCGAAKFQRTAKLGTYGPPVSLSFEDAERAVYLYRDTHPAVTRYWHEADYMLNRLFGRLEVPWGPMLVKDAKIILPNGAPLLYDTLEWYTPEADEEDHRPYFRVRNRQGYAKLYGAKLVENVIQALARVHTSQAMARIAKAGFRIVGMSHDELWIMIKDDAHAPQAFEFCLAELRRPPAWLPGVPLDADGKMGQRYQK